MSIFHRKLFTEAMGDEVLLASQARALIASDGPVTSVATMMSLSQKYGADIAARCYYESLHLSEHGEFIRSIDASDWQSCLERSSAACGDTALVIVPGMFYKEYPDVGADGQLVADIAKQFGFQVVRVPVNSRGSICRNAGLLAQTMKSLTAKNIWLVSLSKGSSEVRVYLSAGDLHPALRGWINIAGVNRGTPHAARKMSNWPRRLLYSVLSRMLGIEYSLLQELHPDHAIWQTPLSIQHLQCIHVVPIPVRAHVQGMLKNRYDKLVKHGPNDGVVPIIDAQSLPGSIYPVWGVDHFMRTPKISELLYRVFTRVVQST